MTQYVLFLAPKLKLLQVVFSPFSWIGWIKSQKVGNHKDRFFSQQGSYVVIIYYKMVLVEYMILMSVYAHLEFLDACFMKSCFVYSIFKFHLLPYDITKFIVIIMIWAQSWENLLKPYRTAKAQNCLCIFAVWSAPLMFAS